MKKGLLIVVEGTDCSGKETQSNLLTHALNKHNIKTKKFCFPNYTSATGKIIAGPYLGKEGYSPALFEEGAPNVDPMVCSLYYAADRKYNIKQITNELEKGVCVVVDRYTESNLAHQGCKFSDKQKQQEFFDFVDNLEYNLLNLPRPDIVLFLYMPTYASKILKQNRQEKPDQHEIDETHLLHAEQTYLTLAKNRNYVQINCTTENKEIKTIEQIHQEVVEKILEKLSNN